MTDTPQTSTVAAGELRQFIERAERLGEEKKTLSEDLRELFSEAKGRGFDVKALRSIIRLRKKEAAEREEEEAMLDLYKDALGLS